MITRKETGLRTTKELGARVRETRKAQGISQEQLAGVANTGVRFVSDLENGKPTVQLPICRSLILRLFPTPCPCEQSPTMGAKRCLCQLLSYDLLSTAVYAELPAKLAMKIEERNSMEWMSRAKFLRMGAKAGMSNSEMTKLLRHLDKALDSFTREMQEQYITLVFAQIHAGSRRRMLQLAN